jgi:hypothetical protein
MRRSASWSRWSHGCRSGLLVWAVVGLVARLSTGETGDGEAYRGRSRGVRWRMAVASSLLGIAGVPPSGEWAMCSTSEAAPRLVVPRSVAPPQHVALSAPRLLEGSFMVIPISHCRRHRHSRQCRVPSPLDLAVRDVVRVTPSVV